MIARAEGDADRMEIRNAGMDDLEKIAEVEALCFPKEEAATREELKERLAVYPNHFWLLYEDGRLISFVNGMVTDKADLEDEMYRNAAMHKENGRWQMIFGVDTVPACQRRGYAEKVIRRVIEDAKKQKRRGLVLTCKETLIPYYEKFGFVNEGLSKSVHGNAVWYQMRLKF